MSDRFFDVYHKPGDVPNFCYRSGMMVYEEKFYNGALISCGYNASGYPLDVLSNFPSHIDRRYYTFDGRRYFSGVSTKSDDCNIPNMTKSTIKHSLCLHLKSFGSGRVKVTVRTDQDNWKKIADAQNGVFAFDDIEFDRFTFNTSRRTTLIIPEKEKRWAEKQFSVYSDEYMRPFGIFDVSYRYKVAGRIKNK